MMMNTKQPSGSSFEALCQRECARTVPPVNVRASVRAAIEREQAIPVALDALGLLVSWFSGIRGWLVTGVVVACVLTLGFVALERLGNAGTDISGDEELFVYFMESGDWSGLL
jgi:hypothetical protein